MAIKKRPKIPQGHFYSNHDVFEGDLVWLTIGARSAVCLVIKIKSNNSILVFSSGSLISVNNWRLQKIENKKI